MMTIPPLVHNRVMVNLSIVKKRMKAMECSILIGGATIFSSVR